MPFAVPIMYQLIRSLFDPVTLSFFAIALAIGFAWWKYRDARPALRSIIGAYLFGWVACSGAVAYLAAGSLEWGYPPQLTMPADAEAIVLFSGGVRLPTELLPETWPGDDTLRRCRMAAQLYRSRPCPIIACGGKLDDSRPGDSHCEVLRRTLREMGVAPDDILLENDSTNTYENAVYAAHILDERGLDRPVLVTDATHLYRGLLCLEQQGIEATAAGAEYKALQFRWQLTDFLPRSGSAHVTAAVMHEAVGLLWYKLRGRI
jgi:uncharacterized SAM-binding protein YcdF (DUF218 family)